LFLFYAGHRAAWRMDGPHWRFFIGSYLAVLSILFDLATSDRRLARALLGVVLWGAFSFTLYQWSCSTPPYWFHLVTGASPGETYDSNTGIALSAYARKLFLEPVGTSPIAFSLFSWFPNARIFAGFSGFRIFLLQGPDRWVLTLGTLFALACLPWLGMRVGRANVSDS
jgi:hypothetical protein